jgi:MoxR-like ATPase
MSADASYSPLFDPAAPSAGFDSQRILRRGDEPPAGGYVYDAEGRIALGVNVALATGRPLLVRGRPGSGKSSLAGEVAQRLGWRYYEYTITSRTRARDLLWSFDAVKRLSDATAGSGSLRDQLAYVTPGALWWAFSASSAAVRGLDDDALASRELGLLTDPSPRQGERAVVLLDEIDKADPDVPNDLLLPLGALWFAVAEVDDGPVVEAKAAPLVIVTTNEERDLPRAFVRRCVVLTLPDPSPGRMIDIATAHFGDRVRRELLEEVLAAYEQIRQTRAPEAHEPNLAEYLDTVAAVTALEMRKDSGAHWSDVLDLTLRKPVPDVTL